MNDFWKQPDCLDRPGRLAYHHLATKNGTLLPSRREEIEDAYEICKEYLDPDFRNALASHLLRRYPELRVCQWIKAEKGSDFVKASDKKHATPDFQVREGDCSVWIEVATYNKGDKEDVFIDGTLRDLPKGEVRTYNATEIGKTQRLEKRMRKALGKKFRKLGDAEVAEKAGMRRGDRIVVALFEGEGYFVPMSQVNHEQHAVLYERSQGLFRQQHNRHISAVMWSIAKALSWTGEEEERPVLFHNPSALNPLPEEWLKIFRYEFYGEGGENL